MGNLNGKELPRSGKKEFYIDKDGVRKLIYITGSSVKGFEIVIEKETYKITDPLKEYVYFLPNLSAMHSRNVLVDVGTRIGTKGQSVIKEVIGYGGKIWTMFPV